MVFNTVRKGWEMPGGRIEEGESIEDAVRREFLEEAGYEIDILGMRDIGSCVVCACLLLERKNSSPEMISELFSVVPENISFERSEYDLVIPWARSEVLSKRDLKAGADRKQTKVI